MSPVPARAVGALVFAALLLAASSVRALDCIDYTDLPRLSGRDLAVTSTGDVALSGDHVFIAGQGAPNGLWIVDVTSAEDPVQVGFAPLPGTPHKVALQGSVAFVACETAGLQIVDVSAPGLPTVIASVPTLDRTRDVATAGNLVWIADRVGGFAAFDVTDPATPVEVVREAADPVSVLDVDGALLIAMRNGDPDNLIRTWDVSDPSAPSLLGTDDVLGCVHPFWCYEFQDVELNGAHAYVVVNATDCVDWEECWYIDHSINLNVWDVSDPANPYRSAWRTLYGVRNQSVSGAGLAIVGSRAYVSSSIGSLFVIDIADPTDPRKIHAVPTGENGRGVAARSDAGRALAFVADAGLSVYDVTHAELPDLAGGSGVDDWMHDVAVIGDVAYTVGSTLASWPGVTTIRGWDTNDLPDPTQLFARTGPGYGFSGDLETASGDLYYSNQYGELVRSDLQAGGAPGPMISVWGPALDTEPVEPYLLVAKGLGGLAVLETFPDDVPALVNQVGASAYRVAADGDLAVVLKGGSAPGNVLRTVSIQDPTAPGFVGEVTLSGPGFRWIALQGRLAAVGGAHPVDLRLVDVSDAAAPVEVAALDVPGSSRDGSFHGSSLYVVLVDGGCVAIDVRVPSLPVVRGRISTDPATAVLAASGFVLACEGQRLSGMPPDCVTAVGVTPAVPSPSGLRCAPNPFRRTTTILLELAGPGGARLDVFDARGRHVRRLVPEVGAPGPSTAVWDGRDARGRRVAPGVYFVRLQHAGRPSTAKVTCLR